MSRKEYTLIGVDGNVFCVMAYVRKAMKECKFSDEDINKYISDATSSDYNNALVVSMEALDKCNERVTL